MSDLPLWVIVACGMFITFIIGLTINIIQSPPRFHSNNSAILVQILSVEGDVLETVRAPILFYIDNGRGCLRASVSYKPSEMVFIRGIGIGQQYRSFSAIAVLRDETFACEITFEMMMKDLVMSKNQ